MARVSSDSRVVTPSDPALYTPAMVTSHHQVTGTGQMLVEMLEQREAEGVIEARG